MSVSDYGVVVGMFLGAFASGWVTGIMFKAVRRVFEITIGA